MVEDNRLEKDSGENAAEREKAGNETVRKILDATQKALKHAMNALKTIVTDPMKGQSKALAGLGEINPLGAGLVFIAIYLIAGLIGSRGYFGSFNYWGGGLGFFGYAKLFVSSLVPVVGLFAGYLLIDKALGKKETDWPVYVFTAGVTLLPVGVLFLLFWVPYQMITAVGIFCLSLMVLLVYSALADVYTLDGKAAFWLTPVLFLVVAFVSKVFYGMIL